MLATSSSVAGSQAWMAPDEPSIDARCRRSWPPAVTKSPPASTFVPFSVRVSTTSPMLGFQLETVPPVVTAARLCRVEEPTKEKLPPTYTVEPLTSNAYTVPGTLGSQLERLPDDV